MSLRTSSAENPWAIVLIAVDVLNVWTLAASGHAATARS
jgi:hypothetical protein